MQPLILVVDDDGELRKMVCRLLEQGGYRTLEASDGERALAVAGRHLHLIDLLLTDVRMPRIDGCDLAAELWQLRPGLPVIFMSGFNDRQFGPDAVLLAKPFKPEQLTALVSRTLSLSRSAAP